MFEMVPPLRLEGLVSGRKELSVDFPLCLWLWLPGCKRFSTEGREVITFLGDDEVRYGLIQYRTCPRAV